MSSIHQIYCTHCTHGSSALERREGEMASRVLGYSARAGSLEPNELRRQYRQVERFLYYYLPNDAPAEDKLRLDAAGAPRRLVYCPSLSGLQMVAQVSYRPMDTGGRPGSYFGHVLVSERSAGAWPVLDCLKLWGASWADVDSPDIPFLLPELGGLDELLGGQRPAVDEGVLLSFLTSAPGETFDDPRQVIPDRWKYLPAADRQALLIDVLRALLSLGARPRDSVLTVVEPSLAALIFFGVARLLPPGVLRDEISFSTFEPRVERLPVTLAATTFHAPEITELRLDAYRGRGCVINTFSKRSSDSLQRAPGGYAALLVATLAAEGWPAVDAMLQGFRAASAETPDELEKLAQAHAAIPALLDPAAPLGDMSWKQSDKAARYLAQAVRRRLDQGTAGPLQLVGPLIGGEHQMALLDLLGTESSAESLPAVRFLLQNLPEGRFAEVLSSERLSHGCKVGAVAHFTEVQKRFPAGCDVLWSENGRANLRRPMPAEPLLPAVLARLTQKVLDSLLPPPADQRFQTFLTGIVRACNIDRTKVASLSRAIANLRDEDLLEFLSQHRNDLPAQFPKGESRLGGRLVDLLYGLPHKPAQFSERIDVLRAWLELFPDPSDAEGGLRHWQTVRTSLESLREEPKSKPTGLMDRVLNRSKGIDYDVVGKRLATALYNAMPAERYTDNADATVKQDCLKQIAQAVLKTKDFVPDETWKKIVMYLRGYGWPEPRRKFGKSTTPTLGPRKSMPSGAKKPRKDSGWFMILVLLVVPAILAGGTFGALNWWDSQQQVTQADDDPPGAEEGDSAEEKNAEEKDATAEPIKPPVRDSKPEKNPKQETGQRPATTEEPAEGEAEAPEVEGDGDTASNGEAANSAETDDASADPPGDPGSPMPEMPDKANDNDTGSTPENVPKDDNPARGNEGNGSNGVETADSDPAAIETDDARERVPKELIAKTSTQVPTESSPHKLQVVGFLPLPQVEGSAGQSLPDAYELTNLQYKFPSRTRDCAVSLHGLTFANQKLSQLGGDLSFKKDVGETKIAVMARLSPDGLPRKAASFWVTTEGQVRFEWVDLASVHKRNEIQPGIIQDWIRTLILEVDNAGRPNFFALHDPVELPAAEFSDIKAEVHPHGFALPAVESDYLLGRGKLHMEDGRSFEFSDGPAKEARRSLSGPLAEELGIKGIYLRLATSSDGKIAVLADFEMSDEVLDENQKPIVIPEEYKALEENLRIARTARDPRISIPAANELAKLLGVKAPQPPIEPVPPNLNALSGEDAKKARDEYKDKLDQFNKAVDRFRADVSEQVVVPAVKRCKAIKALVDKRKKLEAQNRRRVREQFARTKEIIVVKDVKKLDIVEKEKELLSVPDARKVSLIKEGNKLKIMNDGKLLLDLSVVNEIEVSGDGKPICTLMSGNATTIVKDPQHVTASVFRKEVSAVIYRLVDGIRSDDIIVGRP